MYPAAWRAWRRRQVEIEQQQQEANNAPYREKRKHALFNNILGHMDGGWDTEYNNKYVGYRDSQYSNNREMRLNPNRVAELYSPR